MADQRALKGTRREPLSFERLLQDACVILTKFLLMNSLGLRLPVPIDPAQGVRVRPHLVDHWRLLLVHTEPSVSHHVTFLHSRQYNFILDHRSTDFSDSLTSKPERFLHRQSRPSS
jgi:hypothetical protein